jgi:hypothetical protein
MELDIAKGEATEKELDLLITRRHDRRVVEEGERPLQEAWMESERRHARQRQEENRQAWCEYFYSLAGTLRERAQEYDQRASALMGSPATDERKPA